MAKATTKKKAAGTGRTTRSRVSAVVSEAARLANEPAAQKIIAAGLLTAAAAMTTDARLRRVAREAQDAAFEGAGIAAKNANVIGAAIISAATEAARRALQGTGVGGGSSAAPANAGAGEGEKPRSARKPAKAGAQAKASGKAATPARKPRKAASKESAGASSGTAKTAPARKPGGRRGKSAPRKKGG